MRRTVASCYSEHAVKVSDSYCSGTSLSRQPYLNPKHAVSSPTSVTFVYRLKPSPPLKTFFISITWLNSLKGRGFLVHFSQDESCFAKLNCDHKEILMGQAFKQFQFHSSKIELHWNLSSARYDPGPDPISGFCVSAMVDSELCLLIGDHGEDLQTEIPQPNFSLISKTERYSTLNPVYSTRAKFSGAGKTHDIRVKCGGEDNDSKRPVLHVFIDQKKIFQVDRLRWNFRGNQTLFLDGMLVDMMWDVHCWFFNPATGSAFFMFRTRSGMNSRLWLEEKNSEPEEEEEEDRVGFSLLICASNNPD